VLFRAATPGSSNLGELNRLLCAAVMVRRTKAEVLPQLPAKRRQQVWLYRVKLSTRRPDHHLHLDLLTCFSKKLLLQLAGKALQHVKAAAGCQIESCWLTCALCVQGVAAERCQHAQITAACHVTAASGLCSTGCRAAFCKLAGTSV
jgi:hypothetical protein